MTEKCHLNFIWTNRGLQLGKGQIRVTPIVKGTNKGHSPFCPKWNVKEMSFVPFFLFLLEIKLQPTLNPLCPSPTSSNKRNPTLPLLHQLLHLRLPYPIFFDELEHEEYVFLLRGGGLVKLWWKASPRLWAGSIQSSINLAQEEDEAGCHRS